MLCVTYDLPEDSDYRPLVEQLKAFPAWWHHLESTWIVDAGNMWARDVPPPAEALLRQAARYWSSRSATTGLDLASRIAE